MFFLDKLVSSLILGMNECRSFQVGKEKYYIPWLLVVNRKSSEVPMIDVHLVSFSWKENCYLRLNLVKNVIDDIIYDFFIICFNDSSYVTMEFYFVFHLEVLGK